MNIVSKQAIKLLIKSRPSREVSGKILNFALKNEYFQVVLIEAITEATYTYRDGFITNFFNHVKEKQIRKLFTNEAYREQLIDFINWALQFDTVKYALLDAVDRV